MSDDVKLLPYDSRTALYEQLVDITHLLGDKLRTGFASVRKYPPAGLTRAYKAYASTVIELGRDMRQAQGATASDRKPVYALTEEEFAAEMQTLTRHVIRSMPRAEVDALLAEPVYAATAHQEQGEADEQEPNEAE